MDVSLKDQRHADAESGTEPVSLRKGGSREGVCQCSESSKRDAASGIGRF